MRAPAAKGSPEQQEDEEMLSMWDENREEAQENTRTHEGARHRDDVLKLSRHEKAGAACKG